MSDNATRVLFDEPGPRGKVMIVIWSVVVAIVVRDQPQLVQAFKKYITWSGHCRVLQLLRTCLL